METLARRRLLALGAGAAGYAALRGAAMAQDALPPVLAAPYVGNASTRVPGYPDAQTFDFVVYGGDEPAVMAAYVLGLRAGAGRVALISQTARVGGMSAQGGLGNFDVGPTGAVIGGYTYKRWLQPLGVREGGTADSSTAGGLTLPVYQRQFQCKNAEFVFEDMLAEVGVKVFRQCYISGPNDVLMSYAHAAPRIIGLRTNQGFLAGQYYIDGSYYGDVMRACCAYTYGRESSGTLSPTIVRGYNPGATLGYGESIAGQQTKVGVLNPSVAGYTDRLDAYGNPLYPAVLDYSPVKGAGDHRVMANTYRHLAVDRRLTPNNWRPHWAPSGYNPADYRLAIEYLAKNPGNATVFGGVNGIYGIPPAGGGKFCVNKTRSIATINKPGYSAYSLPEAYEQGRALISAEQFRYQMGLYWFIQTDPSLASLGYTALQADAANYGLPLDEHTNTNNWPPMMYPRAPARMIGMTVGTLANAMSGGPTVTDSICRGGYTLDTHDVGVFIDTATNNFVAEGLYDSTPAILTSWPIGYGQITPRRQDVSNLLVPTCHSCSAALWSADRIVNTLMMMGEAAGEATYIAQRGRIAVQDVPYTMLKPRLQANNAVL